MKPLNIAAAFALIGIATPCAAQQAFPSSAGSLAVETIASGLAAPWALAFLPDGRMLVTERQGRLRIVSRDGKMSQPVSGLPKIFASRQGGLHDIVIDRDFARNGVVYFCFAEPFDGGGRTSMARAILNPRSESPALEALNVIFRQEGPPSSGNHFGCRIAQSGDGSLFLAMGDHFTHRDQAQSLENHIGKIVRIRPDGAVPPDNPFVNNAGARPEIWSYGHRNAQGAAIHPATGKLWMHEHGPRGGDEVNISEKGKNYGWPVIGYGIDYSGARIHEGTHKQGMEQPVKHWVPSIAPSGMAFYTGDLFAPWKGSLFVGALAGQMLVRLTLDGERVTQEERLLQDMRERIRDVRMSADGALWLVTDGSNGKILRVTPAK